MALEGTTRCFLWGRPTGYESVILVEALLQCYPLGNPAGWSLYIFAYEYPDGANDLINSSKESLDQINNLKNGEGGEIKVKVKWLRW